jgi:serine/threonine protein kinase/Tol biopolymer transport system component
MTPERWKEVESLYHAAYSRPPGERAAFLVEACADDQALRREIESLLTESVSADGFPAGPLNPMASFQLSSLAPGALAGRTLGVYQLRALVGAGGMGEVYRASDTKLGRDVAIKILPRVFASDPDRLARFEREARMLATLNHPNICGIYGLEEADGVRFLILEFVDGETLGDKLAHGTRLPVAEVMRVAQQIADALDTAHERGIVHRDLKPANIKITPDGTVKVLDFGLAKPVTAGASGLDLADSPTRTLGDTRDGMILGTAPYMSPEQARGKDVDKRTDIWAFGCVVYEMLTGRVTFAGDTAADIVGKILERDPDWSALPAATPASVRRLLLRCLAKDPKLRLRDIGNVRLELVTADEEVPAVPEQGLASVSAANPGTTWLPWVAVLALVAGFGAWAARRPVAAPENPLANAHFSKLTDWEGAEGAAEISPDGNFVVFAADRDGQFDLWLNRIGTGSFTNLTRGGPPRDPPRSNTFLRNFGFSGDSAEIWFGAPGNSGSPKGLLPLGGGTSRAFLGEGAVAPSWSHDGMRLVYFMNGNGDPRLYTTNGKGDPLFVADRNGGDARQIVVPQADSKNGFFATGVHTHNPVWSTDGEWLYFVHGVDPTVDMDVWRVRPSGGSPERMTEQHVFINSLAPLDARTLLYVARQDDGTGPWLWALDVPSKVTRRVSVGVDQYTSVSASRDGRRVVATVANPKSGLWRVPLSFDAQAEEHDVQAYPAETPRALGPRFSGTSLFYLSAQVGSTDGLWHLDGGHAFEVGKGVYPALSEPPAISRTGDRLAVVVMQKGKRHLVVMSADGTNARTLAPSIDIQGAAGQALADWSPDGTWIVAGGIGAQGPGLYKIPVDGSSPVQLVSGTAANPVWSPTDDKLIVYGGALVAGQVKLLGVTPDGMSVQMPDVSLRPGAYRFLPNGKGLVYLPRGQSLNFWLLDLATKKSAQITRLSDQGNLATFDITPDGTGIVFDRTRENSDVVLIKTDG